MVKNINKRVDIIVKKIKRKVKANYSPTIGIVLGSGWSDVINSIDNAILIPYNSLPCMPTCSVAGHSGNMIFGKLGNKDIVVMQGRFHLYEGYSSEEVAIPIRLLKALGCTTVILTNASGGVNVAYQPGDVMVINDHINLTGNNPLIGVKATQTHPIFIDASEIYNKEYVDIACKVCDRQNIRYSVGTYIQLTGPNYETKAEVKMIRNLGADAVGMSTVQEALMAHYLKMKVIGLACISNKAADLVEEKLNHKDVLQVTKTEGNKLSLLLKELVEKI